MADANMSSGVSVIGALSSAYGSYVQGQMQKNTMEFNAAVSDKQGEVTRASAKITEYQKRQKIAMAIAEQQSAYAASGVVATAGSAMDVMVSSLSNANLDLALDRYNTEVAARGLQAQATSERVAGSAYAAQGTSRAVMTAASAVSDYAMKQTATKEN